MPKNIKNNIRIIPTLRNYLNATKKYPWLLGVSIVSIVIVEVSKVIAPIYLKKIVDVLSAGKPTASALHLVFGDLSIYALILFASAIIYFINDLAITNIESRVMRDLYNTAFYKLLGHSHNFFISNFTGTLTRRVVRYARAFEQIFDKSIFNFIPVIVFVTGTVSVLMMRSVMLGSILLAWTIFFVFLQYITLRRIHHLRVERNNADSDVSGALSDAVVNHDTITTFASLKHESRSFGGVVARWYRANMRSWLADIWVVSLQGMLSLIIEITLLTVAIFLWQKGKITVGDFVLIQIYVIGLIKHVWGIGQNMRQIYDAFAEATEMIDIIDLPYEIADRPNAKRLTVSDGNIVFENVTFGYEKTKNVLNSFSLNIAPHEKVALVGFSGAGKSTITKLLLRLYDLPSGSIRIDGQDIKSITQESLRGAIALVPQEPMLFHRSLMDNIRYGRENATDNEVIEAARQAYCLDFISQYPDKFDTMVGERGVKLSGGERQRIAIARAILKDAPILILDEATSSLDSDSESLIQDAFATLMKGKTVIAVAHRLSTVMKMNRIIVMENGGVALTGTHDELLSQKENLYKKLWDIQAGGFSRA